MTKYVAFQKNGINVTSSVIGATSDSLSIEYARGISYQMNVTNNTPSAQTFLAGTLQVDTLTFPAFAGATSKDYIVISAQDGTKYAASLDKTGSAGAPSGAAWAAVASGKRVVVDISTATTAAEVETLVKTALNLISGFTAKITLNDDAADGTCLVTQVVRGVTTIPVPHNAGDTGAGSISNSPTTAGVASTVDVSANSISIPSHGFITGLKIRLTSTGTLPGGLATATDYFVVAIDSDTIKLATSYVNSLVPTVIDITDQGTNAQTHTITPSTLSVSFKLQVSNDNSSWDDVASSTQAFTATGTKVLNFDGRHERYVRIALTFTAGIVTANTLLFGKGGE